MTTAPVAFFDFDGTITVGDTLLPFLRFVVGGGRYYRNLFALSPVLAAYAAGWLRNDRAKTMVLKRFLQGMNQANLAQCGERFSQKVVPRMLRREALDRLHWHFERGHECVLVSASLDLYLEPWGREQGFSAVLCTKLVYDLEKEATGDIEGENCHGQEKVARVNGWLRSRDPSKTYAYGDSPADYPMLRAVDEAWVFRSGEFHEFNG